MAMDRTISSLKISLRQSEHGSALCRRRHPFNTDSSYNPHQTIFWPYTPYLIDQPLIVAPRYRWELEKPDILVQQCSDSACSSHWGTTSSTTPPPGAFPVRSSGSTGINVCSPIAATVATPVPFAIGATGPAPMRDIEIWVDGSKRAEQRYGFSNYAYFNGNVSLNVGHHLASPSPPPVGISRKSQSRSRSTCSNPAEFNTHFVRPGSAIANS